MVGIETKGNEGFGGGDGNKRMVQLSRLLHVSWGHGAATSLPGFDGRCGDAKIFIGASKISPVFCLRLWVTWHRPLTVTYVASSRALFTFGSGCWPDPFRAVFVFDISFLPCNFSLEVQDIS
ncbi:hypothetical protein L3X38_007367 [Prunus dulcis]|uniref:Uncharacterized protein n=1 Tax=Prunus dulcis TaxID=3755 RepID=A0AAD4ZUD4_PRUDU|nr:hypothetical protein L3X38_007367 [Prunus dulcis]